MSACLIFSLSQAKVRSYYHGKKVAEKICAKFMRGGCCMPLSSRHSASTVAIAARRHHRSRVPCSLSYGNRVRIRRRHGVVSDQLRRLGGPCEEPSESARDAVWRSNNDCVFRILIIDSIYPKSLTLARLRWRSPRPGELLSGRSKQLRAPTAQYIILRDWVDSTGTFGVSAVEPGSVIAAGRLQGSCFFEPMPAWLSFLNRTARG